MAYTRSWTNTTPADTDQASTLGAVTRNLRTDIDERMNTLLGGTEWESDPVGGFPLTKVLFLPPSLGYSPDSTPWAKDFGTAGDPHSIHPAGTSSFFMVPVVLPVGCTLTKLRAALRSTSITSTIKGYAWHSVAITTPAVDLLGTTATVQNAALAWKDFGISSHDVITGDMFTVHIVGSGDTTSHYYGLEVTYTVPNLLVGY